MMLLQLFFFERYYDYQKSAAFHRRFLELSESLRNTSPASMQIPDSFAPFESKYYALAAIGSIQGGRLMLSLGKGSIDDGRDNVVRKMINVMPKSGQGGGATLPDKLLYTAIPNPELANLTHALSTWMHDTAGFNAVMKDGKPYFLRTNPASAEAGSSKQLVAVAPLGAAEGEGRFMIAVSSLQPVGDATAVFRSFYLYLYAIAIALILLLVSLYSRMITRPLRMLNKVALKMARMDFSQRSAIRRRDEIGNLSDTLNFLSVNLKAALEELQSANDKLQEDVDKERRLERLRREFVAGVSHELKTPLSLISGYAEGLIDDVQQGRKRERYAGIIREEASRMAEMVGDMLDLSQLEAGQYRLDPERFALDELLRFAADRHEPMLADIEVELALLPVYVNADKLRISQVIDNMLNNAARHTAPGGRIRVAMRDATVNRVEVSVWNEGRPIPEALLDGIWSPFYKAEHGGGEGKPGRADFPQGSGLGLSIVKQILLLHGSEYGVRNEKGGVRFFFTLIRAL
ncbi:sensor histidine kinase [Paenibacillus glycinis]|uniref:histidine kinase n=1 Tax=Paenibacillus glycinis TaxID=2697035 RepID=A0ABW9XYT5_9BACL|nr:HAMP domain-containing sensor histidine kinase [Paenibacillus glycinis]NBD27870.1 HAMP domain-containing protein [Paenibacillus glycinis]